MSDLDYVYHLGETVGPQNNYYDYYGLTSSVYAKIEVEKRSDRDTIEQRNEFSSFYPQHDDRRKTERKFIAKGNSRLSLEYVRSFGG